MVYVKTRIPRQRSPSSTRRALSTPAPSATAPQSISTLAQWTWAHYRSSVCTLKQTSGENGRGRVEWGKSQSAFAYLASASDALAGALLWQQDECISNVVFTLVAARWEIRQGNLDRAGEVREERKKRVPKHEFCRVHPPSATNRDALLTKSTCDDAIWIWRASVAPGMQISASRSSTRPWGEEAQKDGEYHFELRRAPKYPNRTKPTGI
jgi:hypothetical protein